MRRILEADGVQVIEANSAIEALGLLDRRPDAIFVDVDMPHMTGVQFLLQLRQHPEFAQTPATFVTGHGERVEVFACSGLAEAHTLSKPFHRAELSQALSRMLTGVKRRNLRVALTPGALHAYAEGKPAGIVLSLGRGEIVLRAVRPFAEGRKYRVSVESLCVDVICESIRGGLTHLRLSAHQDEALVEIQRMVAIDADAVVAWTRSGDVERGYLREIDATTASVAAVSRPHLEQRLVLQLPFKGQREKTTSELRGCSAIVKHITDDGFSCAFDKPSTEFHIAINDLLSDGTVLSGETTLDSGSAK